jgi:hypothetical protein
MLLETWRAVGRPGYDSIMCSTARPGSANVGHTTQNAAEQDPAEEPIARIGRAIDDLAAQARAYATGSGGVADAATEGKTIPAASGAIGADEVLMRLAELWAQLAQLDPDVGKRLPTYEA